MFDYRYSIETSDEELIEPYVIYGSINGLLDFDLDAEEIITKSETSNWNYNDQMYFYMNDFGSFNNIKDLPAVCYQDGTKEWYKCGLLHRKNAPAIINADKSEYYYLNGLLSNKNGPAVIIGNYKEYWLDGEKHNSDNAAIIYENGDFEWWFSGCLHRKSGPAILLNNKESYYLEGEEIKIPLGFFIYETKLGNKYYYLDKLLHRDYDLPAIEYIDGSKEYWLNGKLSRNTLPAIYYINGVSEYWLNGIRNDNIIFKGYDGQEYKYLNNKLIFESDRFGNKKYYKDGLLHNETGPAVVQYNYVELIDDNDFELAEEYYINGFKVDKSLFALNLNFKNNIPKLEKKEKRKKI